MDPYRGKLAILQIGEAAEGEEAELAYRVATSRDCSADWRDHSELLNIHLTFSGKMEAERIMKLISHTRMRTAVERSLHYVSSDE